MPSVLAATISAAVASRVSHEEPIWAHTAKVATRLKNWVSSLTEAATLGTDGVSSPPPPQATRRVDNARLAARAEAVFFTTAVTKWNKPSEGRWLS